MAKRTKASADEREEAGFEDLLAEAETLAERMEEGGLSLDDSIQAYEKGVANLRKCADLLKAAEEKVKVLLEKDGAFSLRDLDAADDDADDDDGDGEDGY